MQQFNFTATAALAFGPATAAWALAVLATLSLVAVSTARLLFVASMSDVAQYEIRFPKQLSAEAVQHFLVGWSGALPPVWKRWMTGVPALVLETRGRPQHVTHHLLVAKRWAALIESLLTAHLPNVRYRAVSGEALTVNAGAEYRLTTSQRPLAVDASAISAGLLSALQPLRADEEVVVQYVLGPHAPVQPPRTTSGSSRQWWLKDPTYVDSSEAATALRRKQSSALLVGVGRIGVRSADDRRAQQLLRRTEASWHGVRAPGVHLRRRFLSQSWVATRIRRRSVPAFAWPGGALNVDEASGLIGWPIELDQLPGLTLGGCRLLPVPRSVPSNGTVIGIGTFPSTQRRVALDRSARLHHTLVTGATGSGKSVLLSRMAIADLADGTRALVVIDPKDGGLIDRIVESMPTSRLKDVIVFDPTGDKAVGFNPLACTPATRELVVDQVVSIMAAVWRSSWGPRSSDLIRHALLTLTQVPGMTLVEAPKLLSDGAFRRSVLARLDDPLAVGGFWSWFDSLSSAEQAAIVAPPMNKLRSLTSRAAVRQELGHPEPAIDFERILNHRGVLLVRLSSGLLGEETASLLGAFITTQLWQAVMARAALAPAARPPAMVTIDEVQSVLRLPVSAIEDMLTQARGYGVGVTLAHQHLQQLPNEVREAALTNTRSKIVFACSQRDATVFARELGGGLTADDLREIEAFEAVTAVFAEGRTQPPTTVALMPPATALRKADDVYAAAAARHGRDRSDVELAIRRRQSVDAAAGSVGRKRRGSV